MDLKKFLQHQTSRVPPVSPFKPLDGLKRALERDLLLLQRIRPPVHPLVHLVQVSYAETPEDGGHPYVFIQIPGKEGLLLELTPNQTCLLLKARLVNPIVETPLSRERKPLIIRQPQTSEIYNTTPQGGFETPSGAVLNADEFSEELLEKAILHLIGH